MGCLGPGPPAQNHLPSKCDCPAPGRWRFDIRRGIALRFLLVSGLISPGILACGRPGDGQVVGEIRELGSRKGVLGDIAQLGERGVRNAEVGGSSPPISTTCPCSSEDGAAASLSRPAGGGPSGAPRTTQEQRTTQSREPRREPRRSVAQPGRSAGLQNQWSRVPILRPLPKLASLLSLGAISGLFIWDCRPI